MVGKCSIFQRTSSIGNDEKGVSETLEILFLVSMTSIVLGVVLLSFYSLISNVEEESKYASLQNIAGKIVSDIHSIQSLTIYPGELEIKKKLEIPEFVAGSQYTIKISGNWLIVKQKNIEAKLPISAKINLKNSTATSINAYLLYNVTTNTLEVKNE